MNEVVVFFLGLFCFMGVVVILLLKCTKHEDYKDYHSVAQRTYEARTQVTQTSKAERSADLMAATIVIKRGYTHRGLGGVIVVEESTGKCLSIEYKGRQGSDTIQVEFIRGPNERLSKAFLRHNTFEVLPLASPVFESLKRVLLINSQPKGRKDVASGCITYEGILP